MFFTIMITLTYCLSARAKPKICKRKSKCHLVTQIEDTQSSLDGQYPRVMWTQEDYNKHCKEINESRYQREMSMKANAMLEERRRSRSVGSRREMEAHYNRLMAVLEKLDRKESASSPSSDHPFWRAVAVVDDILDVIIRWFLYLVDIGHFLMQLLYKVMDIPHYVMGIRHYLTHFFHYVGVM